MFGELAKRPAAIAGAGAAAVCVWLLVTNWGPVSAGHPTYLIFYVGLLAAGVLVAALALRNPDKRGRLWLSIIGAVVFVVFTVTAIWLKPFGATDVALEAMKGTDSVSVTQSSGRIVMEPTGGFDTGIIFYPGARVDARGDLIGGKHRSSDHQQVASLSNRCQGFDGAGAAQRQLDERQARRN